MTEPPAQSPWPALPDILLPAGLGFCSSVPTGVASSGPPKPSPYISPSSPMCSLPTPLMVATTKPTLPMPHGTGVSRPHRGMRTPASRTRPYWADAPANPHSLLKTQAEGPTYGAIRCPPQRSGPAGAAKRGGQCTSRGGSRQRRDAVHPQVAQNGGLLLLALKEGYLGFRAGCWAILPRAVKSTRTLEAA